MVIQEKIIQYAGLLGRPIWEDFCSKDLGSGTKRSLSAMTTGYSKKQNRGRLRKGILSFGAGFSHVLRFRNMYGKRGGT